MFVFSRHGAAGLLLSPNAALFRLIISVFFNILANLLFRVYLKFIKASQTEFKLTNMQRRKGKVPLLSAAPQLAAVLGPFKEALVAKFVRYLQ